MADVRINSTNSDGMVILSGNDPVNGELVAGGFYPSRGADETQLSFFTSANGVAISVHLTLDFDTVETIRDQLDLWVVNHWPQEQE